MNTITTPAALRAQNDQRHGGSATYVVPNRRGRHGRAHWAAACDCGAIDPTPYGTYAAAIGSHDRHRARELRALAERHGVEL